MKLWRITFETTQQLAHIYTELMEGQFLAVSLYEISEEDDRWMVEATAAEAPSRDQLMELLTVVAESNQSNTPSPTIEELPETDWLEQTWKNFPPREIGRFYVYGSHTTPSPTPGLIPMEINAATAFGSGEHETTSGCLMALGDLLEAGFVPKSPLDMGCGSGILAMATAKLWDIPVLAVDNDPESVKVTQVNAQINNCTHLVNALCNEGFDGSAVIAHKPFDLITANILAKPLIMMAPRMAECITPEGRIILSGLLQRQKADVLAAYEAEGLHLRAEKPMGDWVSLVLSK